MQLNGRSMRTHVVDSDEASVRPASYDLRVGKVIIEGKEFEGSVNIRPQQMFIIVSQESVEMPVDHVAYAMPKTSLCNEGILALNTGIVDPGYRGKLSTTAINFERNTYVLHTGTPFLRLVLHPLETPSGAKTSQETRPVIEGEYLKRRKEDSVRYPKTFLDLPGQAERFVRTVQDQLVDRQRNVVLAGIAGIAIILAAWNIAGYAVLARQSQTAVERLVGLDRAPLMMDRLESRLRTAAALEDSLSKIVAKATKGS
jgi:deoxycytidine triphosphate deaminase